MKLKLIDYQTNSQSRRTVDRVIRNLLFDLSVYFVPKSNPYNNLISLYISSANQILKKHTRYDMQHF